MSRRRAVLLLPALLACGQERVPPARGPDPESASATGAASATATGTGAASVTLALALPDARTELQLPSSPPPLPSEPVGHLTSPQHLAHLFDALEPLESGAGHDDVRIVQYGDSHTASDLGVGVFRRALQARFGDGGRGFVSIGQPWKGYVQDGVHTGMDRSFEAARVKLLGGAWTGEGGCFGLLGIGVDSAVAGSRAWADVSAPSSRAEIAFGQDPRGGSFELLVDGSRMGVVSTRPEGGRAGFFAVDLPYAAHRIEARAQGDGDVVLYGVTLDRPEAGVVVDALGINGAQASTPLRWGEACFATQLRHAAPDLVVLAYGTNEAVDTALTDAAFERGLVDLLGRVARAAPASSCLLLGPPDLARRPRGDPEWRTTPRVAEIVQIERRVADAAGCAFYDQMEAMGGAGAMAIWATETPPRGGQDRVHLTKLGYAALGASFAADLMQAFDEWRAARGLGPGRARRTWGVARR